VQGRVAQLKEGFSARREGLTQCRAKVPHFGNAMAKTTVEERLAEYDRRHWELTVQIAEVGIVAEGSVTRRYTRRTSVGFRCDADPPTLHGPYWQWTAKVNGHDRGQND
jgi:hypothetical protein